MPPLLIIIMVVVEKHILQYLCMKLGSNPSPINLNGFLIAQFGVVPGLIKRIYASNICPGIIKYKLRKPTRPIFLCLHSSQKYSCVWTFISPTRLLYTAVVLPPHYFQVSSFHTRPSIFYCILVYILIHHHWPGV